MKKISRRQFLAASGAVAAAGVLAGCSGGGSTGGNKPVSSAPASQPAVSYDVTEPITIKWWHALEQQYDALVKEVVDGFNNSQDKITVEAEYIGAYKDVNEALVSANAANAGLPAVVVANTDYVASYGASGLYENLDPYIAGTGFDTTDFSAGLLKSSQYDGKQVALPFLHSTQVIYYNKTLADQHGLVIPEKQADMDAFLADVKAKTGLVPLGIPGWDQWYFETMYLNSGVDIITADNTCDLNSDEAMAVTKQIRGWIDAGIASWEMVSGDMRKALQDQLMFACMHTSSMYNTYVNNVAGAFEVGMAWYPAGNAGTKNHEVGGCVLGIPSKNDQATKNAAWVFLQYLTGKDVNMKWAEGTGYMPTRKSVLETQEGVDFLAKKPAFKCVFDNLDLVNPRIQNAKWSELATTWKASMEVMMKQGGDVVSESEAMAEEITDILAD